MNLIDILESISNQDPLSTVLTLEDLKKSFLENGSRYHVLKTINPYFSDVQNGVKTFEIRKNDRDFQVGDYLILVLFKNYSKTFDENKFLLTRIIYKLEGGKFGIDPEYCILGLGSIF